MLEEGDNEDLLNQRRLTLTADGLKQSSVNNLTTTSWDKIDRIWETVEHIFLYISSLSAYIVPKRAFTNKKNQEEFIKEIKKQVEASQE